MSEIQKVNAALVNDAFTKFTDDVIESKNLNLKDFFQMAESKFEEAGYRTGDTTNRQSNVLILHEGAVGDFVAESGAIREIRRIYPNSHITLLVNQPTFKLAEFCPYVDEVLVKSSHHNTGNVFAMFSDCVQVSKALRERYFDVCYTFTKWPDMILLMYMSGARIRITHDFSGDDKKQIWYGVNSPLMQKFLPLATRLVPLNVYGKHMADAFFSLVDDTLLAPVSNRSLEVWYTARDVAVAKSLLKDASPLYALSMGGSHGRKHYPPELYAKLLELILDAEPDATFVILGGGESDLKSAEIIKNTASEIYDNHVIDLTNKLQYRQVAAVLSLCDMYIGNDNGAMHMAAAVKCPVLNANCFPKDLPLTDNDVPILWSPYQTPSVVVQPAHALPECTADKPYDHHGCKVVNEPHCIAQIKVETLYRGFKLLKNRAAQKLNDTLYIY